MSTLNEAGHYAIAGFLYQLIGSGVEALEVWQGPVAMEPEPSCLVLEYFGQDAAVVASNPGARKPKLIQFKFSSKSEDLAPSDLREILEAFLNSVVACGREIDEFEFRLVTNRPYSATSTKWVDARDEPTRLEKLIRNSSRSKLSHVTELASIFRSLEKDGQTVKQFREAIVAAGMGFGMLESEIDQQIHHIVGLLMEKASNPNDRVVRRNEIHAALTGFVGPYELLGPESVELRLDEVTQFQRDETGGQRTIPRAVSVEISRAILEHPVIVVVGDGGSGKSIAASDAILASIRDPSAPPGFGLVVPARLVNEQIVMGYVARWRNRTQHDDGQAFHQSIQRLERAFVGRPLLVFCINGVDETGENARLPNQTQGFLRTLLNRAVSSGAQIEVPLISLVLTCRQATELQKLGRGFDLPIVPHRIRVADFEDSELEMLANDLSGPVRDRITSHLRLRTGEASRGDSPSIQPVSSDALQAIHHPVLWRIFCSMEEPLQHDCLDGNIGLGRLAAGYLSWFVNKAEIRISSLGRQQCETAIAAVVRHFQSNPARIGDKRNDWIDICILSTGCANARATAFQRGDVGRNSYCRGEGGRPLALEVLMALQAPCRQ